MANVEEVRRFLAETQFEPYQSVPLPHGERTPGTYQGDRVQAILDGRVAGRSVLDVGTNYGLFALESLRYGATSAVGIETDRCRYLVAKEISRLHGDRYTILHTSVDEYEPDRSFDVVLLLNVIHHVSDPIGVMTKLARMATEAVVVEFPTPSDRFFLRRLSTTDKRMSKSERVRARAREAGMRTALDLLGKRLPLIGLGVAPYQGYHFSPAALELAFTVHHPIFQSIEVLPGDRRERALAVCSVAKGS